MDLFAALEPRVMLAGNVGTSVELSVSSQATLVGEAVAFSAQVTPDSGEPIDGLWVQLWDNQKIFVGSALVVNGAATISWTPVAGGLHTITAEFPAQADFLRSQSGAVDVNVYRRAADLTVSVQATDMFGHFRVSAFAGGVQGMAVAGAIDLFADGKSLGTVPGTGGGIDITMGVEGFVVTARFRGDAAYFPAERSVNVKGAEVSPVAMEEVSLPDVVVATSARSEAVVGADGEVAMSGTAAVTIADHGTLPVQFRQAYVDLSALVGNGEKELADEGVPGAGEIATWRW